MLKFLWGPQENSVMDKHNGQHHLTISIITITIAQRGTKSQPCGGNRKERASNQAAKT